MGCQTYVLDIPPIQRYKVRGSYCKSSPTRLVENLRDGKVRACGPSAGVCYCSPTRTAQSLLNRRFKWPDLRAHLHVHTAIIVQQYRGNPNPVLLNEPYGRFPILRGRVGYDDNRCGGREHLVGEFVIGRVGRNDCECYIRLLLSVSWASECGD